MDHAIRCQGVSKRYRIRTRGSRTLREDLAGLPHRRAARKTPARPPFIWALQDVSLEIPSGEAVGIIGHNGSGKSTLLKLLAGVTYPTLGWLEVRGRIGPLIEVGAGIHPELTGRENIFMYGSVIGLTQREIAARFDEIVGFADIGRYLDVPVKRYSSGMKVRLGFAIAAHAGPDILLVDEVLAVGDATFQRRCLEKIGAMLRSGATILYVSHELSALERLCRRAVWLDAGRVRQEGPSSEVVKHYLADVDARLTAQLSTTVRSPGGLVIEGVRLTDGRGTAAAYVQTGDPLTVELPYSCPDGLVPMQVALKLLDGRMNTIAVSVWDQREAPRAWTGGRGMLRCTFHSLPLSPRVYQMWVQVLRAPDLREEIPWTLLATFPVVNGHGAGGQVTLLPPGREAPLMVVPTTWTMETGTPAAPGVSPREDPAVRTPFS